MIEHRPDNESEKSLRVGVDGACLVNRRGFGRFARGILGGLVATNPGHQVEIFADSVTAARIEPPPGVTLRTAPSRRMTVESATASGRRGLGEIGRMARCVRDARYDVVYFPTSMTFVPLPGARNVVVTMHDTLAVDRPDLVFPTRRGRWFWWLKEQAARWSAARLTTVSETSRRDLARFFRMAPERIGLITEGVDPVFRRTPELLPSWNDTAARFGLPPERPLWTYVGGLSPHKNLVRLIEAFAGLPEEVGDLVLVGDFADTFHTHIPELRARVASCGCTHRVHFPGFVPDEHLATLYRKSFAVVLPSLWEGFGLPAAEAMARGTPVVHSTAGSLPEIVGGAGLAFDPLSVDSMRAACLRLSTDEPLRRSMIETGLARAEGYRWERAGRLLWDEIESVAGLAKSARSLAG